MMSIESTNTIDAIGVNDENHLITLLATDHIEWGEDDDNHMYLLQEKINSYLRFYESGELFEHYPHARNFKVSIKISGKYCLNPKGQWFYDQMIPVLKGADLKIKLDIPSL